MLIQGEFGETFLEGFELVEIFMRFFLCRHCWGFLESLGMREFL